MDKHMENGMETECSYGRIGFRVRLLVFHSNEGLEQEHGNCYSVGLRLQDLEFRVEG